MCLCIPARILSVDGNFATAEIGGLIVNTGIHLVEGIKTGDYVLIHSGFAIQILSPEEADESFSLLREIESFSGDEPTNTEEP
ncbi:MAG: HypC/HybG/HupF family hydrogenase formation chaperone [Bacteroidota bacterium]